MDAGYSEPLVYIHLSSIEEVADLLHKHMETYTRAELKEGDKVLLTWNKILGTSKWILNIRDWQSQQDERR